MQPFLIHPAGSGPASGAHLGPPLVRERLPVERVGDAVERAVASHVLVRVHLWVHNAGSKQVMTTLSPTACCAYTMIEQAGGLEELYISATAQ